jgi:hypothetical protein
MEAKLGKASLHKRDLAAEIAIAGVGDSRGTYPRVSEGDDIEV